MRHVSTRAVVLKRRDYREADRLLTLFTETHGRVDAIGRGLRKTTSKLSASLELFRIVEVELVYGNAELATLTGSTALGPAMPAHTLADCQTAAAALLKIIPHDEPQKELFSLWEDFSAARKNNTPGSLPLMLTAALSVAGLLPFPEEDTPANRLIRYTARHGFAAAIQVSCKESVFSSVHTYIHPQLSDL